MRWADLPMALMAAGWAFLLWAGVDSLWALRSRNIPGYPATGQIILYAAIPTVALTCLALSAILARRWQSFYDVYPFAIGFIFALFFPVMLFWGGGV